MSGNSEVSQEAGSWGWGRPEEQEAHRGAQSHGIWPGEKGWARDSDQGAWWSGKSSVTRQPWGHAGSLCPWAGARARTRKAQLQPNSVHEPERVPAWKCCSQVKRRRCQTGLLQLLLTQPFSITWSWLHSCTVSNSFEHSLTSPCGTWCAQGPTLGFGS